MIQLLKVSGLIEFTILYIILRHKINEYSYDNWRPQNLSELTPMISNTGLTHLGSKSSMYSQYTIILHELYSFLYFIGIKFIQIKTKNKILKVVGKFFS